MTYFNGNRLSDTAFLDKIINEFNSLNNVPFLDRVIKAMERTSCAVPEQPQKKSSPRHKNLLSEKDKKILTVLEDFFKEQKSYGNKHLRKVFSILSKRVDHINFVTYFNNPFWRLENNLRSPILQLLRENDYYLARSLENNHVYLIPNGFKFTANFHNIYEKMEYK